MINQKEIKRIKETFHNRGYVVLKNFMPKKLINEIKNDVKKLLKMKKIKNKLENVHYLKTKQLSSIHNIANYMSYHKKFLDGTRIQEVFHEIFLAHPVFFLNLTTTKAKQLQPPAMRGRCGPCRGSSGGREGGVSLRSFQLAFPLDCEKEFKASNSEVLEIHDLMQLHQLGMARDIFQGRDSMAARDFRRQLLQRLGPELLCKRAANALTLELAQDETDSEAPMRQGQVRFQATHNLS